jgi:hypothetical protein
MAHDAQIINDYHVAIHPCATGKSRGNPAPTSTCRGGSAPVRPHVKAAQIDANDNARRSSSAFNCDSGPALIRPMERKANNSAA